jgi:hypothetical protein
VTIKKSQGKEVKNKLGEVKGKRNRYEETER